MLSTRLAVNLRVCSSTRDIPPHRPDKDEGFGAARARSLGYQEGWCGWNTYTGKHLQVFWTICARRHCIGAPACRRRPRDHRSLGDAQPQHSICGTCAAGSFVVRVMLLFHAESIRILVLPSKLSAQYNACINILHIMCADLSENACINVCRKTDECVKLYDACASKQFCFIFYFLAKCSALLWVNVV